MTIAIMQPYFMPYIGYWQLIDAADTFVFFDDVNYFKKGFINRNNVLLNGNAKLFTVELLGASQNKLINQISIGGNRHKLLRLLRGCYSKAPYFDRVFPLMESVFLYPNENLSEYIAHSIVEISNYIGINSKFVFSSDVDDNKSLKGADRIINICHVLNDPVYINSPGGKSLYSVDDFKKRGITLGFLKPSIRIYEQFGDNFVPNLSIIDILMFNRVENVLSMVREYEKT